MRIPRRAGFTSFEVINLGSNGGPATPRGRLRLLWELYHSLPLRGNGVQRLDANLINLKATAHETRVDSATDSATDSTPQDPDGFVPGFSPDNQISVGHVFRPTEIWRESGAKSVLVLWCALHSGLRTILYPISSTRTSIIENY